MVDLKTFILKVIYGKNDNYCCLCLNINPQNKLNSLSDDVILCRTKSLNIMDIIVCVLGEELKQNLSSLQLICSNCTRVLVSCYNFIEACQATSKKIHNIVNNFNNFLDNNRATDSRLMYIHIDTEGNIVNYNMRDTFTNSGDLEKVNNLTADDSVSKIEFDQNSISSIEHSTKNKLHKNDQPIKAKDLRCKDDQSSYKCKICLQPYSRGQNLMRHYYRAHVPKKFKCTVCLKKYGTLLMLKDHINTSHSKVVCSHCGKVYNSKLSLKNHEKSHVVRHICQNCGKIYKTHGCFKQHVESLCGKNRNSNIDEKFTCDHCGKQYAQKSGLRVHVQFEHGNWKSYACEWCNKKYSSISKWREHIVTHTKDKKFGCEVCGGTFVTKKSLLYHTRTHTGEKPYKCTYCDQSFLSASRRSTHIKYHHMPAIEECDVCNKKFKGKAYLLKHRRRHFDPNSRLHSGIE